MKKDENVPEFQRKHRKDMCEHTARELDAILNDGILTPADKIKMDYLKECREWGYLPKQ